MAEKIPPNAVRFTQKRLDHRCRLTIPALMRRPPATWLPGDLIDIELISPTTIKLTNRSLKLRLEEARGEDS